MPLIDLIDEKSLMFMDFSSWSVSPFAVKTGEDVPFERISWKAPK